MGRGHAASGALLFTALTVAAPAFGIRPSVAQVAYGALATAGAALLPDVDHPDGTISHTWGRLSKWLCEWVHEVCRGHRRHTHTLLFAALAGGATWLWLGLVHGHARAWTAGVMLYLLLTLAVRALRLAPIGAHAVGAALAYESVRHAHGYTGWLPLAVGLGCLVHIGGDCLTKEGCPIWWPLRPMRRHVSWPILKHAGSKREERLTPVMVVLALIVPWVHLWVH